MRKHTCAVAALLTVAACAGTGQGSPPGSATARADATQSGAAAIDSALAAQTFDSAWSRIAETHYDTAYNGVDWSGVRRELRPRAVAARTLPELRAVLVAMLARLGQSHFSLIPRDVAGALENGAAGAGSGSGDAGLELRLVEGELTVWRLAERGAAAAAGIRPGWVVLAIDGREVAPAIEALQQLEPAERRTARTRLLYRENAALAGPTGSALRLRLRDDTGTAIERQVERGEREGEVVAFSSLPPVVAKLHAEQVQLPGGGCAAVIRFTMWLVPLASAFDRAIDGARGCDGIVIDLRGNPGGVAGMVMGTAGHFLTDTVPLGIMRTRTAELRFKANPRRVRPDGTATQPYAGPLAILTDEMSASTSEFFAGGLQAVGRARVFGGRTAGQALPALLYRLPTGDVMMHVLADFTGPGGVRFEGDGVTPDALITITHHDLLQRRDAPLLAALDWIDNH